MPSPRTQRLAARITLAFGLFALLIATIAWLAWRAHVESGVYSERLTRSDQALALVHELDAATQPRAQRALCAATGGPPLSPSDVVPSTWRDVATRLSSLAGAQSADQDADERDADDARRARERKDAVSRLTRELEQWDTSFDTPLRTACQQGQRVGAAEVQSRLRVLLPARQRLDEDFKHVRNILLEQRRRDEQAWKSTSQAARRWLALLSGSAVALGLAALLVVRSFLVQVTDLQRKLFDETHEREMAREDLAVSQRRMRVLVDHVKDAVIAFDAQGHIQWINPAGETMFGSTREQLMGYPVTLLMPELEGEMQAAASPERATVLDEHGLPWVSQQLTLQGMRRRAADGSQEKITLDVSFVQTRSEGQTVGVCVARDLSELRRLQRDGDAVVSALQHKVLPQARAAEAAARFADEQARARAAEPAPVEIAPVALDLSAEALRKAQASVRAIEAVLAMPRRG